MSGPASVWLPLDQPVSLARLHALFPQRYPHLLESVAHGRPQSRYDILFAFPGETLQLDGRGRLLRDSVPQSGDFLDNLDAAWRASAVADVNETPLPFLGGWFLYLGYELARFIEPALAELPVATDRAVAVATRFPAALIQDHAENITWLVTESDSTGLQEKMRHDARMAFGPEPAMLLPVLDQLIEEHPDRHRERIARTLEYIRAGDTFQVNLARTWRAEFASPPRPEALYARLRAANPAPFAGFARLDRDRAILSSSPERLVEVRHGRISTRPIAGTFPRSADPAEDLRLSRALRQHPKEQAEHVMLVDLERNDLGRVCQPGSVHADELLSIESYPHVHHLVSNVSGQLRSGVTPGDIIRAVFPGGTITGCPKIRTMQIIAELEGAPRDAYTGSMGYLNHDGSLDLNILIRTLQLDGSTVRVRAGGGIVADSDPEREISETRNKARGMLLALGVEER